MNTAALFLALLGSAAAFAPAPKVFRQVLTCSLETIFVPGMYFVPGKSTKENHNVNLPAFAPQNHNFAVAGPPPARKLARLDLTGSLSLVAGVGRGHAPVGPDQLQGVPQGPVGRLRKLTFTNPTRPAYI